MYMYVCICVYIYTYIKVNWSRYRPGVAPRVGRDIALLFHDRGSRRWWVVSSTPRPHLTPGKDPVPILQEAGWALGPVWTGGKSRPHRDSIPDRPARSQSLYRMSYPARYIVYIYIYIYIYIYTKHLLYWNITVLHPQSHRHFAWQLSALVSETLRPSYLRHMIAAADEYWHLHRSGCRHFVHTPHLWSQHRLDTVTCAWGWRLCWMISVII